MAGCAGQNGTASSGFAYPDARHSHQTVRREIRPAFDFCGRCQRLCCGIATGRSQRGRGAAVGRGLCPSRPRGAYRVQRHPRRSFAASDPVSGANQTSALRASRRWWHTPSLRVEGRSRTRDERAWKRHDASRRLADRANIALDGTANRKAANDDAELLARSLRSYETPALVIDMGARPTKPLEALARTMHAPYIALPRADAQRLSSAVSAAIDC